MRLARSLTIALVVMVILGTLFMATPACAWRGYHGHWGFGVGFGPYWGGYYGPYYGYYGPYYGGYYRYPYYRSYYYPHYRYRPYCCW